MRRRLVVIGSIGVIILLMMAAFSVSVCSQKIKYNETQTNAFQHFIEKIKIKNLELGGIIDSILAVILAFLFLLDSFFSGHYG